MSQQRTLLTQSEIDQLNTIIGIIQANLGTHVNDSMSKAHGINILNESYTDSLGGVVGNYALYFDFGTPPAITRMYVPAFITNLGPSSNSDGISITAVGANGSSTAAGIPITPTPLTTTFVEQSVNNLEIYNDLLLYHISSVAADTGNKQVHGGTSNSAAVTLGSSGAVVGRYFVTLGINGTAFNLIADPGVKVGAVGPPQPPTGATIVQAPTNSNFTSPSGSQSYYMHHEKQSGAGFQGGFPNGLTWTAAANGPNLIYTWYSFPTVYTGAQAATPTVPSVDDSAWAVMPDSHNGSFNAAISLKYSISGGNGKSSSTVLDLQDESTGTTSSTWLKVTASNSAGSVSALLRCYWIKG